LTENRAVVHAELANASAFLAKVQIQRVFAVHMTQKGGLVFSLLKPMARFRPPVALTGGENGDPF
jgi:hypothetical protein